jgi:hypothetical protein
MIKDYNTGGDPGMGSIPRAAKTEAKKIGEPTFERSDGEQAPTSNACSPMQHPEIAERPAHDSQNKLLNPGKKPTSSKAQPNKNEAGT